LFLRYNVVKPSTLEKLISDGKVNCFVSSDENGEGCIDLINKYKEGNNGNN